MSDLQTAIQILAEQNIEIFKELIKNQPFDVTLKAIVSEKLSSSSYSVSIAGKPYKIKSQFDLVINDVVYVTFPQNDRSNGFISGSKSITLPPEAVTQNNLAIGRYNKPPTPTSDTFNSTGDLFVVENGTDRNYEANAFRANISRNAYAGSNCNSNGTDYAGYFEWDDKNKNNEDRVGYFVGIYNGSIRIADKNDFILGIVSGQSCIISNSDEDWFGRWERDEFGRYIKEYKTITNIETGEVESGWLCKENSDYDKTKTHVERKDRPEWSMIGMLGVFSVFDDGTCKVNEFCTNADKGIATAISSELSIDSGKVIRGYRVIERMSDNIVKIIFR